MDASWMISISALPKLFVVLAICPVWAVADSSTEFGGRTILRMVGQAYPDDSVFHDLYGDTSVDSLANLRLNFEHRQAGWTFDANYQLAAFNGEAFPLPDDDRRLFDLTRILDQSDNSALVHRLDRLWLGYTSEKAVIRFGRQALSWGNGMFYAPMDLVNPFDPATVDTEYKAGDDMLYLQYLQNNGADIQGAYVVRRDFRSGDVDVEAATIATKYHGFAGQGEFDVLVARHYGDNVLGVGVSRGLGGAIWGADVVVTDTEIETYVQLSTNLSYSWVWGSKNMSGAVEYHFNGFGQHSGEYDLLSLTSNPDLLLRLNRGESFAVGRHYLAGSVMIEMTPLWSLTPTLLMNAVDPSALLQLVTGYSLSDNMTLLASLNIPLGENGSEFGGVESRIPGRYLSSEGGFFAQWAWYF
jgi:hypothetical protein